VDACPPLTEVEMVVDALRADRGVVLNGPTGSGKSITAYQALRRLAQDGFEILRLRDDARDWGVERWLTDLRLFPWPKVLFVDDAQDLSPDTVRELAERADAKTRVLVAGIDHVAGGVRTLKMSSGAAVAQLAEWVRDQRQSIFPMVASLDDHVGSHPTDFFFDRRIDAAAKEPTAWQFFHTLTGGWLRVHRAALELRDCERADLALLLVAVAQIAGVDGGTNRAELARFAGELDRDEAWLNRALGELMSRRLVLDTNGQLRCAHLQNAFAVLSWMLHPPSRVEPTPTLQSGHSVPPIASAAPKRVTTMPSASSKPSTVRPRLSDADERSDREHACRLVSYALESGDTPLRGLSWLADCGSFTGARDVLSWQGVLNGSRYEALSRRALATPASGDIAAAAQLLARSISQSRDTALLDIVREQDERLKEWFSAISPENAWALGDLVNCLYRPEGGLASHVAAHADPQRLARLIIDGGWTHSASTGHALDRLCNVGAMQLREAIRPHLDHDAYLQMFDVSAEFWRSTSLLTNLLSVDYELALELLERVAPRLARQFVDDPVRRWNEMFDLAIHLGFIPIGSSTRRKHSREVLKAVHAFVRALDSDRIAAAISTPNELWHQLNFDSFVAFLFDADPLVFARVAAKVDMVSFEDSLRRTAHDPDRTSLIVASALQEVRPAEIHDILDRLEPDLGRMDLCFAYIAPDVAIRALRRGLPLDLELGAQDWKTAAEVLDRLWGHEQAIATEVAQANGEAMQIGLAAKNHGNPWEGLQYWINTCDVVAPHLVDEMISRLPEGAVLSWHRGLRRPKKYEQSRRKDIAPLVRRAAQLNGHIGDEAAQLLRRFPGLSTRRDEPTSP
jgi:hypothetical protein